MKYDELKKNEIYVTDVKNAGYIFLNIDDAKSCLFIHPPKRYLSRGYLCSDGNPSFTDYREATAFEKAHLRACIKANKFVNKEAVVFVEEIDIFN